MTSSGRTARRPGPTAGMCFCRAIRCVLRVLMYIFVYIYTYLYIQRGAATACGSRLRPPYAIDDVYVCVHTYNFFISQDDKIHWFSITNSTMIVVFLTVMVAMILVRTLSQDIAHYNDAALLDEAKEESVVQCP